MARKLSDDLRASLNALVQEREGLLNGPAEKFDQAAEKRTRDLTYNIDGLRDRIAEVEAQEAREDVLAASRAALGSGYIAAVNGVVEGNERRSAGGVLVAPAYVTREEPVYRRDDALRGLSSFFRDTYNATKGDWAAAERLHRNNEAMGLEERAEARALSTSAGAGGNFAPPAWLIEDWIALARPGRVTADLLHKEAIPYGVSSINLPSVASGATTAVQTTQNTAVSQTDLTTSTVTSGITSIAGKQIVAQQLLDQSGIPFDQVILGDLAADYTKQLDTQVINGSGLSGQLKGLIAWGTPVTWTQASPVVAGTTPAASFQAQVTKIAVAVANTRFAPATHLVMSPERWGWITEAVDSQGRPLVPPAGGGSTLNSFGSAELPTAQGPAGYFAGLPVFTDPALTVASGNEYVLVMRADDAWLWGSELYARAFDAPYSDSMGVLFRVHAYSSLITRYPAGVQAMTGTGLAKVTLG